MVGQPGMIGQPGMMGQPGLTGHQTILGQGVPLQYGTTGHVGGPIIGTSAPILASTGLVSSHTVTTEVLPTHVPTTGLIGTGLPVSGHGMPPTSVIEPGQALGLRSQPNILPSHTLPGNTTGQGEFIFRPLEGKFINDKDPVGKMDPYVKIKLGWHSGKSAVAKSEGTNPTWTDSIALPRKHNETFAKIKVKDKDRATLNDALGDTKVNLDEVIQRGRVTRWFPITKKDKPTGEILLDITYSAVFMK